MDGDVSEVGRTVDTWKRIWPHPSGTVPTGLLVCDEGRPGDSDRQAGGVCERETNLTTYPPTAMSILIAEDWRLIT